MPQTSGATSAAVATVLRCSVGECTPRACRDLGPFRREAVVRSPAPGRSTQRRLWSEVPLQGAARVRRARARNALGQLACAHEKILAAHGKVFVQRARDPRLALVSPHPTLLRVPAPLHTPVSHAPITAGMASRARRTSAQLARTHGRKHRCSLRARMGKNRSCPHTCLESYT